MEWQQFVMNLETLNPASVEEILICHGAQSVTFSDAGDKPVLEPGPGETPLWSSTCITGLFEAGPERPVPHMGWNRISKVTESDLLSGIPDGDYFYFVHSYALDVTSTTLASTDYGRPFTAVVQQDNFVGTQFHPERSGEHGARLLQNFLQLEIAD